MKKWILGTLCALLLVGISGANAQNVVNRNPTSVFVLDQRTNPNVICIPRDNSSGLCNGSAAPNVFATWDGTNLNFGLAPVQNALIYAEQLRAQAAEQNLALSIGNSVEVDKYVQVGDGDDTNAFRRAFAYAQSLGGATVLTSSRVYYYSGFIDMPGAGINLTCRGGTIIRRTSDNAGFSISGVGNTISGCEFDGGQHTGAGIFNRGANNKILFNYLHDIGTVSNGVFTDYSLGIASDGQNSNSTAGFVQGNRVENVSGVCISTNTVTKTKIVGNSVKNCGAEGITLDTSLAGQVSQGNTVDGNVVEGACAVGGVGGIGMDQTVNDVVTNNFVTGSVNNCSGLKMQNNIGVSSGNLVANNVFQGNAGWGYWFSNSGGFNSTGNVGRNNQTIGNGLGRVRVDNPTTTMNLIYDFDTVTGNEWIGGLNGTMERDIYVPNAVNFWVKSNAPTGAGPTLLTAGNDANVDFVIGTKGAGTNFLSSQNGAAFQFSASNTTGAVNRFDVTGSVAGDTVGPVMQVKGSDANIPLAIRSKGTGGLAFQTNSGANALTLPAVANAVDWIRLVQAAAGGTVSVVAAGSDTNVPIGIYSQGTGDVRLGSAGGLNQVIVQNTTGAVNLLALTAGAAGSPARVAITGGAADTNAGLIVTGKGTGATFVGNNTSPMKLTAFTVAGLPTCNSTYQDAIYIVTDATAPTYRGALTGGGTVRTPVYCDGSSWTSH